MSAAVNSGLHIPVDIGEVLVGKGELDRLLLALFEIYLLECAKTLYKGGNYTFLCADGYKNVFYLYGNLDLFINGHLGKQVGRSFFGRQIGVFVHINHPFGQRFNFGFILSICYTFVNTK